MMMFLMILLCSLPVLVLCCLVVAGPGRGDSTTPETLPDHLEELPSPRFFAPGPGIPAGAGSRFPVEMLLSQIERHVRLEQAAAENFLDEPTPEALRSRMSVHSLN